MNREALIALAKESGLWEIITRYTKVFAGKSADPENLIWSDLEYFAALVAAHEREECAKVCEERKTSPAVWLIDKSYNQAVENCVKAIRSRT